MYNIYKYKKGEKIKVKFLNYLKILLYIIFQKK